MVVQLIGRLVGTAAVTLGLFVVFSFVLMSWQGMMITNPRLYEIVLNHRWLATDLIEHFPESIPKSAENVVFYYTGGLLQAGSTLELRVRLSAEAVDEVERNYRPQAIGRFDAVRKPASDDVTVKILPKLHFQTLPAEANWALRTAPLEEFETLLLQAPEPVNLNHPKAAGVSIDRARNEVIYWAEYG